MKKISIIIPAYNEEKHIEKCLQSLSNQDYDNYEIIVVDDGSTDLTKEIVKRFKNVKLKKQEHKGPGTARNFGAKSSKGEILVFVDSDMIFPTDYLTKLTKPILAGNVCGTIHSKEEIANKENTWANCWRPVVPLDKDGKGLIFRAIRKDKFLEYGMFDPKEGYADDLSIMKKSGVKAEPTEVFCYHNQPDSLKEVFMQSRWIGSSYRFWFLDIPLLNILGAFVLYLFFCPLILLKTLQCATRMKNLKYLFYYPIFGLVMYNGKFFGMLNRIFHGKRIK